MNIPEWLDQVLALKIMTTLEGIRHLICCNYALARLNTDENDRFIFLCSHHRELKKVSMSAGVKSRDEVIVEDFFVHWEDLLGLTGVLRDKERKMISKVLKVIRLKEDARLIADDDFFGIFNVAFIRSHVNNVVYLVFNFSSSNAIIYEASFKNKEVMGWGVRILSADKDGCVLAGEHLPTGPNWKQYFYMIPLQCKNCNLKGNVDRSAI